MATKASRLDGDSVLGTLSANKRAIKGFGVRRIGLFGSVASGKNGRDSDVDILVEFSPGKKTFDNYMELKFFLESALGARVDLVVREAVKPAFRKSILEGVRYAAG